MGAARGCPGGAPLAWVPGVRGGALSQPQLIVPSGVRPGPTTHWLWVRGMRAWGHVTNPTARALASWLCALWGRHEGAPWGEPLAWVWGVRVARSPTPDHSSFQACDRGPLPTSCGCGQCGRGDPSPTPPRAGFARCGGGMRVPGGGRLLPGRAGLGALPPPTARPLGRAAGAHYPLAVGAGYAGVGTRHQPHSALLEAGLARCGGGMRAPRGGATCLGAGRPGSGALPPPTARPFGRAAGAHYPLAVGAGGFGSRGPVTNPTARALASWLCALWGRHEGTRGGRLLPGCGASGVGLSPIPNRSSFRACGRGPLPSGCGCGGCGRGDLSPTTQRALLRAGLAHCGGGTRAPGGGASCLGVGRPSRALSHPRLLVLSGVRPGPTTHWLWVRGLRDWGPVNNPAARALASWLCALWGRHKGAPGRAPLAWVQDVRVRALSHPRPPVLPGVRPGPLPTGCGCGGCGRGDPSPTPPRVLLRAGF